MASRPPEHTPAHEDAARARFYMINAVRIGGAAMVIVGLLIANRVIDLPEVAGWIFAAVGMVEFFVVPKMLARKWRTPPA